MPPLVFLLLDDVVMVGMGAAEEAQELVPRKEDEGRIGVVVGEEDAELPLAESHKAAALGRVNTRCVFCERCGLYEW